MGRLDTPVGERTFWGFCIREMKPPGRAAPCSQVGAYPRERTEAPKRIRTMVDVAPSMRWVCTMVPVRRLD